MTRAEWPEDLTRGDLIRVSGSWSDTGGETSLLTRATQIAVTQARTRYPIATPLLADLDDTFIHRIVALDGDITEKSGTTVYLDDGHDEIPVEVKEKNDRAFLHEGDRVTLTGVLTKKDGTYRLRSTEPPVILTAAPEAPDTITITRERDPIAERNRYLAIIVAAIVGLGARPIYLYIKRRRNS
jgi:hypothetical protein